MADQEQDHDIPQAGRNQATIETGNGTAKQQAGKTKAMAEPRLSEGDLQVSCTDARGNQVEVRCEAEIELPCTFSQT